ncbi:hypothetical protein HWV62_26134 [Athelia sp. TMB]|nr:hypothetical protein HWV62_26134 [Athelia sp. TMB]
MASSSTKTATKPPIVVPGSGNNIIINSNQRLNPILECIRNVGKEFGDIVPDFQVGKTTCVLYLSLKYHRLHPEYIHQRIERLGHSYSLRILLMLCDVVRKKCIRHVASLTNLRVSIKTLSVNLQRQTCLINNITVMVAWTVDEAGLYLSTFKQYEHRPPDMIRERVDKDYNSVLRSSLTSIGRVNKTDVETLKTSLGSFADIAKAPADQLRTLPGFGQIKVKKIKDAFEKPFRNQATSTLPSNFMASSQRRATYDASKNIEPIRVDDNQDKGKGKELPTRSLRQPRPQTDEEINPENGPPPLEASVTTRRKPRSPSPMWDLELDLNASDEDEIE